MPRLLLLRFVGLCLLMVLVKTNLVSGGSPLPPAAPSALRIVAGHLP